MKQGFLQSQLATQALAFRCPRWGELPAIALYLDQVTGFVNELSAPLFTAEEPVLTKSMVNNYVKQKLVAAPTNKKYEKQQIAQLIAVCFLKQVFSIPEIAQFFTFLRPNMGEAALETAYNSMCAELENALQKSFGAGQPLPQAQQKEEHHLLILCMECIANKVYAQKRLAFENTPE